MSKGDLVDFVQAEGFDFVATSNATTRKGYYRLLDSHVVGPLRERGWVDVERVGREKYLTLTPEGERTLRAFRYLLE
ncbi:DUF6293 family protein [Halospeciosus flavus]|uniref:DUF6293 family protein n=1 Tax=Halospeciosus flavus TaxID=3032283 RepID=UPI00360F3F21